MSNQRTNKTLKHLCEIYIKRSNKLMTVIIISGINGSWSMMVQWNEMDSGLV